MKALLIYTSLVFLIQSCATSEEKKEALYNAVEDGNLSQLKEIVGNGDLEGQSELHNLLAMSSCNRVTKKTNEDVAEYLTEKGAKPKEEEVQHPQISSSFTIRGPIAITMDGPDCLPLLKYYLDNMSSEDVAKAAKSYKATTSSDLYNMRLMEGESKEYWIDWYLQHSPAIYTNHFAVYEKNMKFCQKGEKENCEAANYILAENKKYHRTIMEIAFTEACEAHQGIKREEELMNKQLEFGKQTGIASPRTYDAHARQAQEEKGDFNFYKLVWLTETGRDFDPSYCVDI